MICNFLVPSTRYPVGGTIAMVEFANGLARRGHEVHISHVAFVGDRADSLAEMPFCEFDPRLQHHFPDAYPSSDIVCGYAISDDALPAADFVFCFDDRIPANRGLPLVWVQAFGVLGRLDAEIFAVPCPKLCTSRWLVQVAGEHGVPEYQRVHLPYGLRHDKYRLLEPIAPRGPRISMLYNSHPIKGAAYGIDAIGAVLERFPEADAMMFGTTPLVHTLPDRVAYYDRPDQRFLVEGIYNTSRAFVSSSPYEGFGLAAVEAMACGCALVTAANGGSADYAIEGDTALVAPPMDAAALAAQLEVLLLDDPARIGLAERGLEFSRRFDWDRSAEILESFLREYRADPDRYRAL